MLYKLVFICFLLAVPACLLWCLYDKFIGQKLAMLKVDGVSAKHLRGFIGKALDELKCIATWEKQEDTDLCS